MKRIVLALLVCVPCIAWAQATSEVLQNSDIVKLAKLELPPTAIISKIKSSSTHFDVSVDALIELKKQGVSGDVVSEMITANSQEQKAVASQKDMNDPRSMRKAGIYLYTKGAAHLFDPIDPTVISNTKSGGFGTKLAQRYTYGIAKNNRVSELSGAEARKQIPNANPNFYFYFNAETLSPNEFALVKLTEKKNSREMIVGSSNAYGNNLGIDEKQKIDFVYDLVADGIYKVYSKSPLEDGEYCFIYTGATPKLFSRDKVYDFGISAESKK